ncbi:MAG: ABC transporter permease subunit [candidate division NC10 bacterium]|nr:ABC transporter permease subunit [candidate division NC10 bacterium]
MHILPIFKRELRAYFASSIAYVVLGIFALISGYFFYILVYSFHLDSLRATMSRMMPQGLNLTELVLRPFFRNSSVTLLFLLPVVTMRLFAEEKRVGTAELLFTYPVRDIEVLLGKFLAALILSIGMVASLLPSLVILAFIGPIEWGPVATGLFGLLFQAAAFIALGTLASSMTENQIVAAISAFGALLILWVIGWVGNLAGPPFSTVITHISVIDHLDSFAKGVIESKDLIYYMNFTILFSFLALRVLESKRWRG